VVAAAAFLVDSESRLKTPESAPAAGRPVSAPQHMASAKTVTDPSCGMPVDAAKAQAAGNTLACRGATYYFCSKECRQKFRNNLAGSSGARQGEGDD
jgi:YHS domain-containing protein